MHNPIHINTQITTNHPSLPPSFPHNPTLNMFLTRFFFALFPALILARSCSPGNYITSSGCKPCRAGTFSTAVNAAQCTDCPAGTFNPHPGAVFCRPCRAGTYSSTASRTCTRCPSGQTSTQRSKACIRCSPGTHPIPGSTRCVPCKPGTYSDGRSPECTKCNGARFSPARSTSISQCTLKSCPKGREPFRQRCEQCRLGSFSDSVGTSPCKKCPEGTVSSADRSRCIICPRGTFARPSYPNCTPCAPGTATYGTGNIVCRIVGGKCPPNYFEKANGDCATCPSGSRFNRSKLRCEKCASDSISPGGTSSTCQKCPNGQLADFGGTICSCPTGSFKRGNNCIKCPMGTSSFGLNEFAQCMPCPAGLIAPKAGSAKCTVCPYGTVTLGNDRTKCASCPPGLLPNPQLFSSECVAPSAKCPNGLSVLTGCGASACIGAADERPGIDCVACAAGEFSRDGQCVSCPDDSYSLGGVAPSCIKCPNGRRRSSDRGDRCSCAGYFALGRGMKNGNCSVCQPGTSSNAFMTACVKCPKGKYAPGRGNIACLTCPPGTWTPRAGASSCTKCPPGTSSYGKGDAVCTKIQL